MKKKLSLLAAPVFIFSANVQALNGISWDLCPYVGFDGQVRHIDFQSGLGAGLFKKNYAQGNVFAGLRFCDNLGIELGYERTARKSANAASGPGSVVLNDPIPANEIFFSTNTFRIYGPHINLVGYIPFCICEESFDFYASIGLARLKAKFIHQPTAINDFIFNAIDMDLLRAEFKKRKTVFRATVGVQYWMNDNAGVRFGVSFENTARLKNFGTLHHDLNTRLLASLKNSVNYGLGVFWKF